MKLIVCGSSGRMGTVVCKLAAENGMEIVAGIDILTRNEEFPVFSDIKNCARADAVICFLPPTAEDLLLSTLEFCVTNNIPLVICTTGIEKFDTEIAKAAE
ncbi:MAG: 4-hydroxy-tetrahydrodipicolinate reductase, partial [Defluviitaleaceae bacterium]|nr:4-hydroxy-tetrahydrodipicolinate reductase [Defluviitaleaceae bacterium]